jgi:hypothetical protein
MPGSVDKAAAALQLTGLLLLILNTSFVASALTLIAVKMKKVPLIARLGLEVVLFVGLFWVAYFVQ